MTGPQTHESPAGTGLAQNNEAVNFGGNSTAKVGAAQPRFHVEHASADALLSRLDRVRKAGKGWMARCPAHDDGTASLSITEVPGKVLVRCFAGCRTDDVLGAVGLSFKDLFPPRHWPDSPEERRQHRRRMREAAYLAALGVLPLEVKVVQLAAQMILSGTPLDWDDYRRVVQASNIIDGAANTLIEARLEWPDMGVRR